MSCSLQRNSERYCGTRETSASPTHRTIRIWVDCSSAWWSAPVGRATGTSTGWESTWWAPCCRDVQSSSSQYDSETLRNVYAADRRRSARSFHRHRRQNWPGNCHMCTPSNSASFGVHNPNGILIGSAVFAGLTIVTNRPTDPQREG